MFRKDYTTVTKRLLSSNPSILRGFIYKVGTDIAYSEEVYALVGIPKVGQNSIKNLLIHGISDAKNLFLIQLRKIILLTPAKSKQTQKNPPNPKECDFNK